MASDSRSGLLTAAIAAAVLVAAVAGLYLLLRDGGDGRTRLGDYDPASVEAAVDAALDDPSPRPVRTVRLVARRIEWRDGAGAPFLESPRVTASITLRGGPDGGVVISNGVIQRPRLRLVQTGEEEWNYDRPLAPLLAEDRGEGGGDGATPIYLRDMVVDSGYVLLDLLEARYALRSLDVRLASGQLAGPGLEAPVFNVARAEASLVLPDTTGEPIEREVMVADARIRVLDGAVAFEVDRGRFGTSRLASAEGVWDPALGGLGVDVRMDVTEGRLADLPWLPGEVPEGTSGSFELRLEPRDGDRTAVSLTSLDLSAPGSSATGSFRAVIGGAQPVLESVDMRVDPLSLDLVEAFTGPLPYGGTVRGTVQGTGGDIRFDLQGQLTTAGYAEPFRADLAGRVALTDDGVALRNAAVSLDRVPAGALSAVAPGLPFRGPITGTIQLDGPPTAGPLDLDLRLEAGGGIVTLNGMADLSGAVPRYDLSGRLVGVNLQRVLEPAAPPAELHAEFELEGRGTDPATADASLTAHGTFTGWETEAGDTLAVRARVAGGTVDVDALTVELGPAQLSAAGRWNYMDGGGDLRYDLAVSRLEPLGPYLPADPGGQRRFARGSIELEGTASGTLEAPRLEGEVAAREFRWGEWAAERLSGEYALDLAGALPRVETDLEADELRTPAGDFDAVDLVVDFGRPDFQVAVRADQEGGGGIVELEADGRIDEQGRREIFLRRVEVDLEEQRWRLTSPAEIAWTAGETVRIQDLALVQTEGDGRIRVEGTVAPMDELALDLEVVRLPVGDILDLLGQDLQLAGDLTVDGRFTGPADAPDVDVEVTLVDGTFRDVPVSSVQTSIRYQENRLYLEGEGLLGDSARVDLDGSIPARIQLEGTPLFALIDDAPIDVNFVTRTFPLSTLDPGLVVMEAMEGRVQADLHIAGTPASPSLSGSAGIAEGAVTIPMLDRRFQGIRGTLQLDGREAVVQELVIESDGTATVSGSLTFTELTNPALDLTAELERFRIQGVEDETGAGVWGTVALEGSLGEPVLTGDVRANDGAFSMAPFQQPELSERLVETGPRELLNPGVDLDLEAGTAEAGLRIRNLQVEAGDDLWFVTEEARARLGGTLTVNTAGESVAIQGTLQGEGGTFELAVGPITRQFRILSSEIRFFGSPEPNPRLDILASRLVRVQEGGDVDVQVRVSGTLENPSLSLATAAGADIPESELLSFILFGRPTSDLGQVAGAESGFLDQGLAYTGLGDVVGSRIRQEIGFLDYLRLDYLPSAGAFYATAGVQFADDFFLDADIPLSNEQDVSPAVGLEYRFDDVGTVRLAWEPVQRLDRLVGRRTLSLLNAAIKRQALLAWRKRWTY